MDSDRRATPDPSQFERRAAGDEDVPVVEERLSPEQPLPAVFRRVVPSVDAVSWAKQHRDRIEAKVRECGAVLLRNFNVSSVMQFRALAAALSQELIEYKERSSPRSQVGANVYTSTDYPASEEIFPHNEHSYAQVFPQRLFFFCETPAESGGQTPIADCRRVLGRIDPGILAQFEARGWMYLRNLSDGLGLPWQTVFQTSDKAAVEAYCRKAQMTFEWKPGERLRTRQVRGACVTHPDTLERVWFNHATFFHVTTLNPAVRDVLLRDFALDDLPNHTFFGDGTPIPDEAAAALRDAYRQEMVYFDWRRGDVLVVDNILTAHSRAPFTGERRVLVAMADPIDRGVIDGVTPA